MNVLGEDALTVLYELAAFMPQICGFNGSKLLLISLHIRHPFTASMESLQLAIQVQLT